MDDFERELTRLMREGRTPAPFEPGQRARLYDGIRARRRTRVLVRAGGSALAVAGLSVGLALLPQLGSGSPPADPPLPATGSTAPPPSVLPSTSLPPTRSTESGTPDGPPSNTPDSPPSHTPDSPPSNTPDGPPSNTSGPATTEPGGTSTPTSPPPGG